MKISTRHLGGWLVLAIILFAQDSLAQMEPTLVVQAKLLAKSETPPLSKIWIYREGLVVYEYQVLKVGKGHPAAAKILVTHWGVKQGLTQEITKTAIGTTLTLNLRPFKDMNRLDEVYRSETIDNLVSPMYHDVGQKVVLPDANDSRWNYKVDVSRNMRTFHLLKNQLKLVVVGDCQGWFSNRTELHYGEENKKTPVALNLCQERSYLGMYECLVDDYILKMPRIEWVVIAYHTRWINGNAGWRACPSGKRALRHFPADFRVQALCQAGWLARRGATC